MSGFLVRTMFRETVIPVAAFSRLLSRNPQHPIYALETLQFGDRFSARQETLQPVNLDEQSASCIHSKRGISSLSLELRWYTNGPAAVRRH